MDRIPCTRWEDCPVRECPTTDRHHEYYPKSDYTTTVESMFRNLGSNIVQICRREHNEIHATQEPPEKPSTVEMLKAIVDEHYPQYTSVKKRKAVERMLRQVDL